VAPLTILSTNSVGSEETSSLVFSALFRLKPNTAGCESHTLLLRRRTEWEHVDKKKGSTLSKVILSVMFKANVISFCLGTLHYHAWLCSRFDGSRSCGKH